MNMELKFRAWRAQVGRFRFFDISTGFNVENSDVFKSVEQFTSLQDANGDDIYEGDIVKHQYFADEDFTLYKVVFGPRGHTETIGFHCVEVDGEALWSYYGGIPDDLRDITIIGNIHQNKELLNERN